MMIRNHRHSHHWNQRSNMGSTWMDLHSLMFGGLRVLFFAMMPVATGKRRLLAACFVMLTTRLIPHSQGVGCRQSLDLIVARRVGIMTFHTKKFFSLTLSGIPVAKRLAVHSTFPLAVGSAVTLRAEHWTFAKTHIGAIA